MKALLILLVLFSFETSLAQWGSPMPYMPMQPGMQMGGGFGFQFGLNANIGLPSAQLFQPFPPCSPMMMMPPQCGMMSPPMMTNPWYGGGGYGGVGGGIQGNAWLQASLMLPYQFGAWRNRRYQTCGRCYEPRERESRDRDTFRGRIPDAPRRPEPPPPPPPPPPPLVPVVPPVAEAPPPLAPAPRPPGPIDEPPKPPADTSDKCEDYSSAYRPKPNESEAGCPNCDEPRTASGNIMQELLGRVTNKSVRGLHRTMATMYQSCVVLEEKNLICGGDAVIGYDRGDKPDKRILRDPKAVLNSHQYLKQVTGGKLEWCENRPPHCKELNLCQNLPLFRFGGSWVKNPRGKLRYSPTSITTNDPRVGGVDCMDFLTAGLHAAGLSIVPNKKEDDKNWSTAMFLELGKPRSGGEKAQDCMEVVEFKRDRSDSKITHTIEPGDVVVWNGHAFMIESLQSADPFGAKKAIEDYRRKHRGTHTSQICSSQEFKNTVDFKNLKFTIAHSSSFEKYGFGPMRIRAKDYFPDPKFSNTPVPEFMMKLVERACVAEMGGVAEALVADPATKKRDMVVLRHANANGVKRPECSRDPVGIEGDDCVKECAPL